MNNKQILENAPEGAQYSGAGTYWGYVYGRGWCRHSREGLIEQTPRGPLRSLTDIQRIAELTAFLARFLPAYEYDENGNEIDGGGSFEWNDLDDAMIAELKLLLRGTRK